jgi:hypothetical protein
MASNDPAAAELERSSDRWLAWLAGELARRPQPGSGSGRPRSEPGASSEPGAALPALWDLLEEWFASEEFACSALAAAVAAPPDGRGPAAHAALVRHRQALRRLLEDLAGAAGAGDPAAVADQLLLLVEGAIVGAVVDRHPGAVRHARELAELVLRPARS